MINTNLVIKISREDMKVEGKYRGKNINDIKVKHKKLYIKVQEEEIHIRLLNIPKVNKYDIEKLIENQLIFMYGKNAEDIVYTYDIWNQLGDKIQIIIYCVKSYNLNLVRNIINNNIIKNINFIQFCMLNKIKNKVHNKDYILIINYKNYMYFLGIGNTKLISDRIVHSGCNDNSLIDIFKYTINKMNTFNVVPKFVYGINLNKTYLIKYIQQNMYNYINFKEDTIDYFKSKGLK